ncbi:hypothetical protein ACWEFL_29390 [Streptomyces sp. NPDC004838]
MSSFETGQEHPYEPETGELAKDAARNRVGRVMGKVGGYIQLRPVKGGLEWDALADDLKPAAQSDLLSEAVAEANAQSRQRRMMTAAADPVHGPRICGALAVLPVRLASVIIETTPDTVGSVYPETFLRCPLEEHSTGPHAALVWQLDDASRGELWVQWDEDGPPSHSLVRPDCPGHNGRTGMREEACTLFAGHFGRHSFELRDPDEEILRAGPEYGLLKAEIDALFPVQPDVPYEP